MRSRLSSRLALMTLVPVLLGMMPPPPPDPLDGLAALDDAILAEQRGGFTWQGMEISFGADIRSYVDDELALRTVVSWSPEGSHFERYVAPSLTEVQASQIAGGILTSGGIRMRVGNESVFLANGGQTAFVHNGDALQNILINTASNVSLAQQVDATLDVSGYDGFRDTLASARLADAIGAAMGAGTVGAIGP